MIFAATLVCICVVAGLFYLDREKGSLSHALWLPGLWVAIVGSRPVSMWFGVSGSGSQLDGSPVDAACLGILLVGAIAVLIARNRRAGVLLRSNWPILIYFAYCLFSVAWSPHADVSLKRWIKSLGDPAMALVIVTDPRPLAAIRTLVSRLGFLFFPFSLLLIRYYGTFGRSYTAEGEPVNIGVCPNKNALGLIVLMISMVILWNVRWLWNHKKEPNRSRHLAAQGVLLGFGALLFWQANCSTAKACFALGALMMVVSNMRFIKTKPARVHAVTFAIIVLAVTTLFWGGQAEVAGALGRESSMSGRTDIWEAVIPTVRNPLLGAGYDGFWISPSADIFHQKLLEMGWYPAVVLHTTEAHDGYIETYLNLGWIGVGLLAILLITGYQRAFKAFQRDPELGGLLLAFVAAVAIYSITEAGFRALNPAWIFLLVAIFASSGVTTGIFAAKKASPSRRGDAVRGFDPKELVPESGAAALRRASAAAGLSGGGTQPFNLN